MDCDLLQKIELLHATGAQFNPPQAEAVVKTFYEILNVLDSKGLALLAFDGIVVAHNELLERKPELLNRDPFGAGWMLIVKPSHHNWRDGLVTGGAIAPAFDAWLSTDAYKDRAG